MIQSIWELFNVSASQTGKYQTEQGALSLKQEGGKEFDSRAGHIPEKDEPMSLHNARLLPDDTDNSHTIILNSKGQAGKDRLKAAGCQALGAKHGPHAMLLVLTEGTVAAIGIISTDTARTKCVTYI